MTQELANYEGSDLRIARDPEAILTEAKKAAAALMKVVEMKKSPVKFGNEQYIEFEDWQTVAKFYGITAKVTNTAFVDYGGVKGFEAGADAIGPDGRIISHAEGLCLNDEDNWSTRTKYEWYEENGRKHKRKIADVAVPLFQLKSMAQTRACAKVLRNVLAWVVVLAGFKPSVAEEMTGDENQSSPEIKKPKPKIDPKDLAEFKPMKSKYPGKCKACEKDIPAGEEILFNSKIKGAIYHPDCLNPKQDPSAPISPDPESLAPKAVIDNLKKLASAARINLLDRIGLDGFQVIDEIKHGYANKLLAEFAEILDGIEK